MQINVIYDESQGSLPAAFVAAVNYVVNYFDTAFTNNVTVNIDLGYGEIAGQSLGSNALGESETYFDSVGYSQAVNALKANQPSAAQQSAYSTLPGSSPLAGGTLWVSTAEEKALGLLAGNNSAVDGYVGFSSSYPFDYSTSAVSGQYYFDGVVAHEFSEVLGRDSLLGEGLGGTTSYAIMDLFRYSAAGTRQLGTGGPAYFSINNGTTNLDSWNTNPGGDLGDWAGSAGVDSFLAFSPTGQADWITPADVTLMNVLGWDTAPAIPPPVVTADNQSVAAGQQVALSSLFSISGSGITQYKVWFSYPEGGSPAVGTLTNNGTPIALDQWVTLSSLSGWVYTGSASSGTDKIWLSASNGQSSEALASITDPGNVTPPPVVTADNQSVAAGQQVALSSLFSISGSGITQYKVWFSYPGGGSPAVGTLTNNGTPIALDQWVTLSSLSGWVYAGSASPGTDKLWLIASNGQSGEALANITDPGIAAPVVTANNQYVTSGQQVALSSLFSISGSGITQYKVWFSYPEGGSPAVGTLTNNDTPIAPDQWVTLSSLSGWVYTGAASSGTDKIWLIASNGQSGEAVASITDPVAAESAAPVVTANNRSVTSGQQVALSSLFSVSGSGITQYKVWFSYPEGGSPAVGSLTNNGTPIAPDQWVTISSLSGWVYTGSASPGTDKIWLIASNGQSSEALANITDPGIAAPVVTANDQSVATGQQVALSSLFSTSSSGITQYKVWFSYPEGGSPAVGTLTNNGTPIAPDQWVALNSLNGWVYTGSASAGTDRIWLIASNGQSSEAFANITDPGLIGHSSPLQSDLGNEQDKLGQSVALLSQYMAASLGQSDFGGISPPNVAFPDQSAFLAPPAPAHSHQT